MTPEQAKQRLEEFDAKLAAKLAELGFTPDEIKRQLDSSIPQAQRKAEADEILTRQLAKELADPSSATQQAVTDQAIGELAAQLPELEANVRKGQAARRRRNLVIGGVAAVVGIAIAAFVLTRGREVTACEQVLGPLDRIEGIVGFTLRADPPVSGRDECSMYVWAADRDATIGNPIVIIDTKHIRNYEHLRAQLAAKKFGSSEQVAFGTVKGELFVAEDRHVDPAAFEADVKSRVGRSHDPMGDALGNLPPAHHAVLLRHGQRATQLQLEQRAFTPAQAKELVAKLTAEWQ